jgi:hypothetical protein
LQSRADLPHSRRTQLGEPTACRFRETVTALWRFTAYGDFMPSSSRKTTSDGTPRIVDVIGATVTVDRYPMALSRVNTTTGLFLSGRANRYSRTSPRATLAAMLPPPPKRPVHRSSGPPRITLTILFFPSAHFQFRQVLPQRIPDQSGAIALGPSCGLVGSLQQLPVENNLNCFHHSGCGVYSTLYSTSQKRGSSSD